MLIRLVVLLIGYRTGNIPLVLCAPIITQATFAVPSAIFSESFLSYLGLGIQAPEPSIGVLLAEGQRVLTSSPHLTLFPALVVSALMLAFNMFGNGLRDAFDPRMRGL